MSVVLVQSWRVWRDADYWHQWARRCLVARGIRRPLEHAAALLAVHAAEVAIDNAQLARLEGIGAEIVGYHVAVAVLLAGTLV